MSPGIWRLLGGLSIITGTLDAGVYVMAQLLQRVAARAAATTGEPARILAALEPVKPAMELAAALLPVCAVALVVVGVGVLGQRRWARRAALGWSVAALLALGTGVAVHVTMVRPRVLAAREEARKAGANDEALVGYDQMAGAAYRVAAIRTPLPLIFLAVFWPRRREKTSPATTTAA